jgi:hypothetical protein
MTRWRLKPSDDGLALAVYSVASADSTDDEPLTDPWNNKSRLQLHTDGIFPSTTPELTQIHTINFPGVAAETKFQGDAYRYVLFSHGYGRPCMVEGSILDVGDGRQVEFNGSVPVWIEDTGFGLLLALGSTATHVVVEAFGISKSAIPALSFPIQARAYNFLVGGQAPTGDEAQPRIRHYPGSHTILARGAIDTRRRYMSAASDMGEFGLAVGETLKIVGRGIGDDTTSGNPSYVQNEIGWRWRYSVDGYVKQTLTNWRGEATNGGAYDAEVLRVTL